MAIPQERKKIKQSLLKSKKEKRTKMASVEKELWGRATMLAEELAKGRDLDFDDDELIQGYRLDQYRTMMNDYRKTLK